MGTIPKTRCTKSVSSSSASHTACSSLRSGSEDSAISAYRGRRSTGNVCIEGGASAQSEVSKHLSLQTKAVQNELVEANRIIKELTRENRNLRIIQNRQDVALSTFQFENADLPQLLNSYAVELRAWKTKIESLQKINKKLEQKLKADESLILSLNDQTDYYKKLNNDRYLKEREQLVKEVEKIESTLKERDDDMKLLDQKLLVEQKSLKQQLREQQENAKKVEVQLGDALNHLKGYKKLNVLRDNPIGKPSKTPKPQPKKEPEKKDGNKSNLYCSKPVIRYSKSVGSCISKPSLGSSGVVSNAQKLGSTRANNSAPSTNAGYMRRKQLAQKQQVKLPQQRAPQKQCKPIQRKVKELQPGEKNLTATSDSSDDVEDYTDTRDGRKSDEESVRKESKSKVYISDLEDLYGDEDDLDGNQIDNWDSKNHLITARKVSKDDGVCDVYTKLCKNTEIGDAIMKPIYGKGTTGRKL